MKNSTPAGKRKQAHFSGRCSIIFLKLSPETAYHGTLILVNTHHINVQLLGKLLARRK